jgi:hypothetical protein
MGLTIAGYGGVDQAPVPQQKILIDRFDGSTREARKIHPVTGQYVYNAAGQVEGMGGVQQLVLMRAKTLLNSSAVKGLGLVGPAGVVGPNTLRQLREDIMQAMKDIIDAKLIDVIDVHVVRQPNGAFLRYFRWRDLTASATQAGAEKTNF